MPAIFLGVRYHIAECVPLPRRSDTKALLDANGAVVAAGVSEATHIVTTSMEFDGWPNVSEDVKIVTPSWIDKSMILGKRQGEAFYSAEPAKIFSGVTAVVAEVSQGSPFANFAAYSRVLGLKRGSANTSSGYYITGWSISLSAHS